MGNERYYLKRFRYLLEWSEWAVFEWFFGKNILNIFNWWSNLFSSVSYHQYLLIVNNII